MPSGVFSVESKEKRQKIPSQHQRTKTRCGNSFFSITRVPKARRKANYGEEKINKFCDENKYNKKASKEEKLKEIPLNIM